jgi:two-component system, cell cycle sensor histidine kinase and response regulator CckA
MITQLLPMLQKVAGERVRVTLRLDPDVSDVLLVRASFDQAMVNLVVNARDAMPKGGNIAIVTRNEVAHSPLTNPGSHGANRYVVVEVMDTGQGIASEHIHQVFDPFFTTKAAGNGTGLGLTTVQAFVRNSGGFVNLFSEVGGGTTISLHFPDADAAEPVVGAKENRGYASLS